MNNRLIDGQEIKQALDWLTDYWDKPAHPEYYQARSIDEAVGLLNEYGKEAKVIASGIDILSLMKNKVLSPATLVNMKNIPNLRYICEAEGNLDIGSLTLINDIQRSALIQSKYPLLYQTACSIASPQIRNMATMGGNLLQEVRCWYYRRSPDTGIAFNCRRKIESGQCYAANGENQYHAIVGSRECCSVCPSDMAGSLLALDARINTINTSGSRSIPIDELYTSLGNTLENGEIVTGIHIPEIDPRAKQRFLKFRIRKAIDFAIVSVSAVIITDRDVVSDARIVLGGVAYKPYRAFQAERLLKGKKISQSLANEAAQAAVCEMSPLSKNGYKVPILEALVKRSILE